ncbi:hypothetical protein MFIFM68171_06434 [Madurella fahalii]|uniref:C2H2-type domain-containing protein n=1 Tax=Madurella fahalii TaxID=1157608 RepID=A0ABQ0GEN7_9PEZI
MQRSSSQSTTYTVGSSYTTSTDLTDYSSFSQSPIDGPSTSHYQYPYPHSQDTDHLLSATGSQYQHSDRQLPQVLQLSSPLQLFNGSFGSIEEAARQATEYARSLIDSQGSYGLANLSIVSSEAVDEALWRLQEQGGDSSPRAAVQDVLHQHLYRQFTDIGQLQSDPNIALEEAAYQLQLRLQGPKVLDICYYAIVATLAQLARDLEACEEFPDAESLSPAPHRSPATPTPITPTTATAGEAATAAAAATAGEKERYPCLVPGCKQKGFSRSADLDRHYKMVHLDDDQKKKYMCDYRKCPRYDTPFFRQDHFRDHLRLFHKEDLLRRGTKPDHEWWGSRSSRAMFSGWWRCNRCLVVRVQQEKYGFVCPGCGNPCEAERRRQRERMRMV